MVESTHTRERVYRRVGIVGGGQLARMTAQAAGALDLTVTVLDPTPDCPAREFARQIVGGYDDPAALRALAEAAEVVTLDIEAVDATGLAILEAAGHVVAPSAELLRIIQDKLRQKTFLREHGFPTSEFVDLDPATAPRDFGLPCVVKTRRHGYDGRGVKVVRDAADAAELPAGPCLAERLVDIDKELAIMVARNHSGECAAYPVVEAEFNAEANILDTIHAPAHVAPAVAERCRELALAVVAALDGVGIFGIEFFLDRRGEVLVNEISPRPHNSGHYTIEACVTSQFEQHLRAVTNMPLGPTRLLHPAASFNLLGEPAAFGEPRFTGIEAARRMPGVAVHLYGKHRVQPFRKMGHVTVTGPTLAAALGTAGKIKRLVRVMGSGQ